MAPLAGFLLWGLSRAGAGREADADTPGLPARCQPLDPCPSGALAAFLPGGSCRVISCLFLMLTPPSPITSAVNLIKVVAASSPGPLARDTWTGPGGAPSPLGVLLHSLTVPCDLSSLEAEVRAQTVHTPHGGLRQGARASSVAVLRLPRAQL